MAGYIDGNLLSGEHVYHRAAISLRPLVPQCLISGLFLSPLAVWLAVGFGGTAGAAFGLAIILLAWFFVFLSVLQHWLGTEVAATNRRVIIKRGIIARDVVELQLDRIEGVVVNQGICGRVFGYGTLAFSGVGTLKADIPYVNDPPAFRRNVLELMEAARNRTPG